MSDYYVLILKLFKKKLELKDLSGNSGEKLQSLTKRIDIIKFNMGVAYFLILSFLIFKLLV